MRKKYTKWYIKHEKIVRRSLLLRLVHYWLFSPSVYLHETAKGIVIKC